MLDRSGNEPARRTEQAFADITANCHDIRNLMQVILGYAELMRSQAEGSGDLMQVRYADSVLYAGERAAALAAQCMHRERAEDQDEPEVVDLGILLCDEADLIGSVSGHGCDVRLDLPDSPLPIGLRPSQVRQLLLNLVGNATAASAPGSWIVVAADRVQVHARECACCEAIVQGDWVQLTVTDTGCGMTPDQVSAVFDAGVSTESGARSGLGLAVVRDIIRGADGHICIDSTPGEGTTMTVLVPAQREQSPVDAKAAVLGELIAPQWARA